MSSAFQVLVEDTIKETEDSLTLVFQKNDHLKNYKSGQFITLLLDINGQKIRRSYSFSSSPELDAAPSITVKKIQGGQASVYLTEQVKKGQSISCMPPAGIFTLDKTSKPNLLFVGAGSGITPLISMIKSALAKKVYTSVTLIYSNRNEDSVIFKQKLSELAAAYPSFRYQILYSQPHDTSLMKGRLNQSIFLKYTETLKLAAAKDTDFFLCGPEGMMDEVKKALSILAVPSSQIHTESFSTSHDNDNVFVSMPEHAGDANEITVMYQGSEYKFQVKPGDTILQSALDNDIDLPYSCMSGLCTACMGKCISGKVEMGEQDGLSEKEMKNGYVLTCVGRPAAAGTVIEID